LTFALRIPGYGVANVKSTPPVRSNTTQARREDIRAVILRFVRATRVKAPTDLCGMIIKSSNFLADTNMVPKPEQ
jgi:hypothetical protein